MADIKIIIGLAACLAIGLVLNILACVLYKNGWPILVAIAYFLAPFPNIICGRTNAYGEVHAAAKDWGFFFTGFLVTLGFGIPSILAHSQIITLDALFLALAGGIIVYGTILVYLHFFYGKNEDPFA
eukprot:TRINITY_DN1830_c0_g1_i1.p1 TRINITY_DN1830_c0_g1~~TRINITY_DN1830_c0_g1_i1.p1  ORF type:complete len:127 (+),score=7.41 TRINITY_DN1830_c0_g1_i1:60-440(+)